MRIVNQSRDTSVSINDIAICVDDNAILCIKEGWAKQFTLGIYKSRERALEVFSEIHKQDIQVYYMPEE